MSTLCGGGGANSGGYIDVKRNCVNFLLILESGNEKWKKVGV